MERYQYDKLPERSIRLFELDPGSGPVSGHLRIVSVTEAPPYEAISYAWGDPSVKVDVLCDGEIIKVTPNLLDGLLRMRFKTRARILWADAICINQEDLVERGHQVTIMTQIYERAERVLVWLGEDDGTAKAAFRSAEEIFNELRRRNDTQFSDAQSRVVRLSRQIFVQFGQLYDLVPSEDFSWDALGHLFEPSLVDTGMGCA